ncbi:MAG TPA: GGDEF domain-containing response regulator, partial [Nitrosomonas sp.]|nr:GGDEF domain-containing response regulator [Nitrosomonas sp.]
MLRNNLKILLVGYSEAEADLLYADLTKINLKINYKAIADVKDIRAVFYESDWQVLICNHTEHAFNFMDALEIWKQAGRNIPFIIYSDEMDEEKAISAIRHGVHDYIYKGHVARLVLAIERELKDEETRRAKLQAESKIYRLAYYDDLTGFPKRNLFCEKVTSILSKESNADKLAAVYFIKIARLPYINSTYGYNIGDMLIQQLSYRMSVYANSKCLLSRIESSKFAFFNCEVNSLEDIQKFADRIMKMVSTPIMINGFEFCATINIGVSVYPTHSSNISMLLAIAE